VRAAAAIRPYDATAAVIHQLEASLSASPTRQQPEQQQQAAQQRHGQHGP
jgi:hypothetical protein